MYHSSYSKILPNMFNYSILSILDLSHQYPYPIFGVIKKFNLSNECSLFNCGNIYDDNEYYLKLTIQQTGHRKIK